MVDRHRLVHVSSSLFPSSFFRCILCVRQVLLTMFLIFFNYIQQVPCRLYLPYDGNLRFQCHRRYSIGILCLWYHLQMWCWFGTSNMIVRTLSLFDSTPRYFLRKQLDIPLILSFFYCFFSTFSPEQTVDLPNHHREVSCAQEWKRRNSFTLVSHWLSW